MSVAGPQEALLQGYLHKQSRHLKLWKVRYFLLTRTELLYAKKSGKKLRGCLRVDDFRVIDDQNRVTHLGNFVIELKSSAQEVHLSAPTEQERARWVCALRAQQSRPGAARVDAASDSTPLLRNLSESMLRATATIPVLMAHNRRAGRPNRCSKERKDERKRQRLPRAKKAFSELWLEDVLPLGGKHDAGVVEALCFAGIPKELRGRAWAWVLGNRLQVNEDLFKICKARALAVRREMALKREALKTQREQAEQQLRAVSAASLARSNSSSSSSSGASSPVTVASSSNGSALDLHFPVLGDESSTGAFARGVPRSLNANRSSISVGGDGSSATAMSHAAADSEAQSAMLQEAVSIAEMLVAHGERSIRLVNVDMPRTFGHHPLFQPGADGTERTTEVLEAYICYRPDLGYVQGMSYLAAALCFHMDSFTAFKALVSLMSTSLLFDMFRLEAKRTFHYLDVYNQIIEYELPRLHAHFLETGIEAQMYAVDWALTLFTRSLPLDLALRIWDCYVYLGTPFFFQASVGILTLYEDTLLAMEAEDIMRLLHNIPKSTSARDLFAAIESVTLSSREITELLAGGSLWSPDSARQIEVQYPESYD
ncbi:hypothetical protein PybrP1_010142 [[Pythium] brassicae (nom. inval.)]|nr:hypothetical protein PybrP1_010142 [[Pythium] brassicae (nom. inval.)]